MLDYFLEHNVQKKLHIFSILHINHSISVKELAKEVNISSSTITTLIDELNFDLEGIAEISKDNAIITINVCEDVTFFEIFHAIYRSSNMLKCLCYMIMNDSLEPFSEFSEEHHLSRPSAYRIRQNCVNYLREIGLDVDKNRIVGNEYRIRFLIALLHYKYGIDCYDTDSDSIQIAREFIISTNDKIDMNFLECTSAEYGYFEYLLILAWKRKKYPLTFEKSEELESLKQLFVFPELKKYLQENLENKLNISFSDRDYDYIFLVYCCTNSCVFADKWKREDIELVHKIIFANGKVKHLIKKFENKFCLDVTQSHAFKSSIIYFYKKCFFNLHCIIPDKHFYLDSKKDSSKLMVRQCVSEMIDTWKKENHIPYPVDAGHLQYLSLQIFSIVQQFMKPVQIFIVSDLTAELEILKLYLARKFSRHRITIKPVLLNAQDLSFMSELDNSVIITKKVFAHLLSTMGISKNNSIVPINIEVNELDKQAIVDALVKCEKNIFRQYVLK